MSESWLANAEPGNNRGTAAVEPEKFHSDFDDVGLLNNIIIKCAFTVYFVFSIFFCTLDAPSIHK